MLSVNIDRSFQSPNLDTSYTRYADINLPTIKSNMPNFIDSVPESYRNLSLSAEVLFLANIDYLVGVTPWNIEKSYREYKPVDTHVSDSNLINHVKTYRRLRLLEGDEYKTHNKQSNIILNLDYNPNSFYESIKTFISSKSDILVSTLFDITRPVMINFLYILANVSESIRVFRPFMVTGMEKLSVVVAYKTNDTNKLKKDILLPNKPKILYKIDTIPELFIKYINNGNNHIDNSRGWLLVNPGYPFPA